MAICLMVLLRYKALVTLYSSRLSIPSFLLRSYMMQETSVHTVTAMQATSTTIWRIRTIRSFFLRLAMMSLIRLRVFSLYLDVNTEKFFMFSRTRMAISTIMAIWISPISILITAGTKLKLTQKYCAANTLNMLTTTLMARLIILNTQNMVSENTFHFSPCMRYFHVLNTAKAKSPRNAAAQKYDENAMIRVSLELNQLPWTGCSGSSGSTGQSLGYSKPGNKYILNQYESQLINY